MSGIEPLTPFGFTVQRAQAQRTKEDLQSHAHCPARTINTGIDPLNTHTISIWQFQKWKNWLFDAMRPFILLQQRGYQDTTFRTMEMVLLCP